MTASVKARARAWAARGKSRIETCASSMRPFGIVVRSVRRRNTT